MSAEIKSESSSATKDIGFFWHPACSQHFIPGHPESPERVSSILASLRQTYPAELFLEAPRVTNEQILLFHSRRHVNFFQSKDQEAQSRTGSGYGKIDSDTVMMKSTAEAAYRAAGSVCAAVDKIYNNEFKSIFCCVRPPGHHAETSKMCGFCFLANAGIAAKYAQSRYGVKRVAVLDFDVHHGNGTEDGFLMDSTLFYGSTHEKDNFPQTGKDPSPAVGAKSKDPLHRRIVNRYLTPYQNGRGLGNETTVREQFYEKWREILDEMVLFRPELVIISAGFDAHDDDPLASCDLMDEDFYWATQAVLAACARIDPARPPPCVSVLEGGYDIPALTRSALAHVRALAEGVTESLLAGYPAPPLHSASASSSDNVSAATTTAAVASPIASTTIPTTDSAMDEIATTLSSVKLSENALEKETAEEKKS